MAKKFKPTRLYELFFICTFVYYYYVKIMKKLAILASGSGTNAENIARLFHQGNRIRVGVVLCNRKQAGVYERMQALGVPVVYMPNSSWDSDPDRVVETLRSYDPDLVVLAGFMRAVRPEIIEAFSGRVVNIHPSLLPAYGGKGMYGHHVHEAVIAAGEKKSGVTVHYVTEEIDGGEIVMQQEVDITPEDTPETLEAKIHPVEYDLYPRAIVKALDDLDRNAPCAARHEDGAPSAEAPSAPRHDETQNSARPSDSAAGQSPDEAWAKALYINNYSDAEAERARSRVEERRMPPPSPGSKIPAPQISGVHPAVADAVSKGVLIPKSYMWVSVVMAVLFSTIPGIVAIVYSASVSSRLSCGDIAGAGRASRNAQIWIIISFVLGVLAATLWVPMSML